MNFADLCVISDKHNNFKIPNSHRIMNVWGLFYDLNSRLKLIFKLVLTVMLTKLASR